MERGESVVHSLMRETQKRKPRECDVGLYLLLNTVLLRYNGLIIAKAVHPWHRHRKTGGAEGFI